jgi:hypothetical protein
VDDEVMREIAAGVSWGRDDSRSAADAGGRRGGRVDVDVEAVDVAKVLKVFGELRATGAIGRMLRARSAVKHAAWRSMEISRSQAGRSHRDSHSQAVTDLDEDAILIAASNLLLIV